MAIACACSRLVSAWHVSPHVQLWVRRKTAWSLYFPRYEGFEEESDIPLKKRLRDVPEQLKRDTKLGLRNAKEWWARQGEPLRSVISATHDELKIHANFGDPDVLKRCVVTTDADWQQGFSRAELVPGPSGRTALFRGYLDTAVPKDGKTFRAGCANLMAPACWKTFGRRRWFKDWDMFNHFVVKLRGDGRTYLLVINTPGTQDMLWHDQWNYPLHTHGGPYWQYAKIPFSKLYFSSHARIQDKQPGNFPAYRVHSYGITLRDKFDGPFQLEIEWMGLYKSDDHVERCAYEQYRLGYPVIG